MSDPLIVPLDGSRLAEAALPLAIAIAGRTDAAIHLVHVRRVAPPPTADVPADEARAYMVHARDHAAGASVHVEMALIPDAPLPALEPAPGASTIADQLLEYAARQGAALIVMTTHGRGGFSRMWFGSVADALLRRSTIPLLLVPRPADGGDHDRIRRVLIALGGNDVDDRIVRVAHGFTSPFRPRYTLLRIVPPGYTVVGDGIPGAVVVPGFDPERERDAAESQLRRHARAMNGEGVEIAARFEPVPARAILRYAEDADVDLIVVGTHQRRGFDRLVVGSVADKVMRGAECGVLVVPPG